VSCRIDLLFFSILVFLNFGTTLIRIKLFQAGHCVRCRNAWKKFPHNLHQATQGLSSHFKGNYFAVALAALGNNIFGPLRARHAKKSSKWLLCVYLSHLKCRCRRPKYWARTDIDGRRQHRSEESISGARRLVFISVMGHSQSRNLPVYFLVLTSRERSASGWPIIYFCLESPAFFSGHTRVRLFAAQWEFLARDLNGGLKTLSARNYALKVGGGARAAL